MELLLLDLSNLEWQGKQNNFANSQRKINKAFRQEAHQLDVADADLASIASPFFDKLPIKKNKKKNFSHVVKGTFKNQKKMTVPC